MKEEELKQQQLAIIDGQLLGCLLYVVSLIVSILIIYNERRKVVGEEEFLTTEQSQSLILLNRILILILIVFFLYLNYKSYQLAKDAKQDTSSLELQIVASLLSIIVALIALYVTVKDSKEPTIQPAEIENPYA